MREYFPAAVAFYAAVINIIGWFTVKSDKSRARKHLWRIRESTLFLISAIGGAVGIYGAMLCFRHKTKHKRFMLGIPCIVLAEAAAVIFYIYSH